MTKGAQGEVPLMVRHWREQPLRRRLEQAARDYIVSREHPALAGLVESMKLTAWRYGLEEEALSVYLDTLSRSERSVNKP